LTSKNPNFGQVVDNVSHLYVYLHQIGEISTR